MVYFDDFCFADSEGFFLCIVVRLDLKSEVQFTVFDCLDKFHKSLKNVLFCS